MAAIPGNLLSYNDSSFETDVSGWTTESANNTIARSTAQAYDGSASMLCSFTATGQGGAQSNNRYAVNAGTAGTTFACRVYCSAARTFNIKVNWYTSSGTLISSSTSGSTTLTANYFTPVVYAPTAPSNAATAQVLLLCTATTSSDKFYIDWVFAGPVSTPASNQENFLGGNVPSIVNPLPFGINTVPVGSGSSSFVRTDVSYDYAIAGIPFFGGESLRGSYFRRIYQRDLVEITKQQFDNQQNPGEQSLLGWWLRSQSSFGLGAGAIYADYSVDQTLEQRYLYSEHLDTLSTPNQVQLLQGTKRIYNSATSNLMVRGYNYNGTDYVLVADGAHLWQVDVNGNATGYTMPGGIGTIASLTDDGTNYYFADTTGVWKGALGVTGSAATLIWNVPSSSGRNVLGWVKSRLVGCLDNAVYELAGTGPTLPTAAYTNPNASFTFTSVIETPQSIMCAGKAGSLSEVFRFDLDTSGLMPVLTGGIVTCVLPTGEIVNNMVQYVGAYVALCTSQGVRIATIDDNGDLVFGPLVVMNANGVYAAACTDRFVFAGNTNNAAVPYRGWTNPVNATVNSCLIRMDLSQTTNAGGQPYANDLDAHEAGTVYSACVFGDSTASANMLAFSVNGSGVFVTDPSNKESSGALYTSRIRYDTLESKHFKYVFIRTNPISDGSISCTGFNAGGGEYTLFTQENGTFSNPVQIGVSGNSQEWYSFAFTLSRGTVNTNYSPTLLGYQLRAIPGVDRQFTFTLPLVCFDHEQDKNGQLTGQDGWCMQRLNLLEAAIADGNIITLQDLNYGVSYQVIVDQYEFQQQANERGVTSSAATQDGATRGGFIILQCRAVA